MKKKYVLVPDVAEMTPDSVVGVVWVGSSRRERAICEKIQDLCDRKQWWFEPWGEHVDQRLWYENARVFHTDGYFVLNFKKAEYQAAEALKLVREGDIVESIKNRPVSHTRSVMMSVFMPQCLAISHRLSSVSSLLIPSRKNLSHRERDRRYNAVLSFCLISALFVLGMVLEAMERYLLN